MPGVLDAFERFIAPIKRRLSLAVVRALLDTTDDGGVLQVVQVIPGDDEVVEDVEVMHPYGFTSHAPKGSPVLMLAPNGNHELAVALVGWKADRPAGLEEGEVALAHENGNKVVLKNNGDIEIGEADFLKLINENFKATFEGHVHNFTAAPSGVFSTSTPASDSGVGIPPVGGAVKPFPATVPASDMTSKTKAE